MQISEIEQQVISGTGDTSYRASIRNLSAAFGLRNLFVHEETLQPGDNGSRPHFHTVKEEMIVVLSGLVRVTCGEKCEDLTSGSVFGFRPGPAQVHYISNIGDDIASYLSIGTADQSDVVIYE